MAINIPVAQFTLEHRETVQTYTWRQNMTLKRITRRAGLRMALGTAMLPALTGLPWAAVAQPSGKSVRWLVPFPAGGGSDFIARSVASGVQVAGEPIIIDNKPGGNGAVAIADLKRSPKDGHTWINVDNGIMVFNPFLYKRLGYNPNEDLRLVAMIGLAPMVLAVGPSAGVKTAAELIAKIKANPGKLAYASAGAGGPQHMAMEMLLRTIGSTATHVAYRGSSPALGDLVGGQIPFMYTDLPASRGFIQSGKIQALAVASKTRMSQMPDVPTLEELGIRDVELSAWTAVAVAGGTPDEAVAAAARAIRTSLAQPAVSEKLLAVGIELAQLEPRQQQEQLKAEQVKWAQLIKELKITLD